MLFPNKYQTFEQLFSDFNVMLTLSPYYKKLRVSFIKEKRCFSKKQRHRKAFTFRCLDSYSPITLIAMREQGYWGWSLFIFIWACAIAGTVMSFAKLKDHSNLETLCFVGMGLSVLVAFKPLIDSVSPATVIWIIAEGVCYITGAVFYSINKKKYMHSVFHFFVLAGSVCHIIAVWDILMKYI
jgi:channel protein (hemolysin III family)